MDMGVKIDFKNPMDMGVGVEMTFENGNEWENSPTGLVPIPCPFLEVLYYYYLIKSGKLTS